MTPDPQSPTTPARYVSGYVSPFGQPAGLAKRLREWTDRIRTDRSAPWFGLGLIADLEFVMKCLNMPEFATYLRDRGHEEWADVILANDETVEAVGDALKHAGLTNFDPVAGIETLQRERDRAQPDYQAIRAVLVDVGALAADDHDTPLADLVRALLS